MAKLNCSLCHELLYDPVTLPCGFSVCRNCFPRYSFVLPSTEDQYSSTLPTTYAPTEFPTQKLDTFLPDTPTLSTDEESVSAGFQCPVAACSIVHVFRHERVDIFVKNLIEKSFPSEFSCYTLLHSIERGLSSLGYSEILFDMNYSPEPTASLMNTVTAFIDNLSAAIEVCPILCKLRIYRAALLWYCRRYGDALLDIFMVYKTNAYSLKSNHFLQTSAQASPQSNIPICYVRNPLIQNSNSNALSATLPPGFFTQKSIVSTPLLLSEFECPICLSTLYEPVTKPCGHTSCKRCIVQSAKQNTKCCICRTSLPSLSFLSKRHPNQIITALLLEKFPEEYKARELSIECIESKMERIPIFVCSLAFPGCTYGFHLFEPRYRKCLETNKRFGVCLPKQDKDLFADYGTVVEIVRCEAYTNTPLEDSEEGPLPRYIIETKGLYRFKVESRGMERGGYHFANVTRINDLDMDDQDSFSLLGQEEKDVRIRIFDGIECVPIIHSLVKSVEAISNGLEQGKSFTIKQWSPATLSKLMHKLRLFVGDLFAGIHPQAKLALVRQFGEAPSDISDLTYWITQIIPLENGLKCKLLEVDLLKDRLKIIFSWIENATSWRERC